MGETQREPRDPTPGGRVARFFRGAGYLAEGWNFVFSRHPTLLKLCLLPLLINLVVFVGVGIALYFYYGDIVNLIWARPDSWLVRILWYLLYIFIFLLVLLLGYITFFVLQAILSAPFNDLLSERTESLAFGQEPPPLTASRFLLGLGKTVAHELIKLGIYLAFIIPLFLLNLVIPVVGPLLFLFVGFYISSVFFAYDFMDYSMGRRMWSFGEKWRALKKHRALTVGFGAALAGALLIPVFGLLCVPMAAVGGTLLFCDLERSGAFEAAGPAASPKAEPSGEPEDAPPPNDEKPVL
jgi:CysZ protein